MIKLFKNRYGSANEKPFILGVDYPKMRLVEVQGVASSGGGSPGNSYVPTKDDNKDFSDFKF